MLMKKIIAGIVASALTITSVAVTSIVANAADEEAITPSTSLKNTPEGKETVIETFELGDAKREYTKSWDYGAYIQSSANVAKYKEDPYVYVKLSASDVGTSGDNADNLETILTWADRDWALLFQMYTDDGYKVNFIPVAGSTSDKAIAYAPISCFILTEYGALAGNVMSGAFSKVTLDSIELVRFEELDEEKGTQTLVNNEDVIWINEKASGYWKFGKPLTLSKISFETLGDFIDYGTISAEWTSVTVKKDGTDITSDCQFIIKLTSTNGDKTNYDGSYSGGLTNNSLDLSGRNNLSDRASTDLQFSYSVEPTAANDASFEIGDQISITIKGLTIKAITTEKIPAETITLNKTALTLENGDTFYTLQATVTPANSTDKVEWSTDKETVATVEKGVVTTVGPGTATITATAGDKKATCTVEVIQSVESISLNKHQLTLKKGGTDKLTATVLPDNATDKTVTWTSSNEKVATVDENGNVTAKDKGTAIITAKAGEKEDTCEVTVTTIPATAITLKPTSVDIELGKTATLEAILTPEDSTDDVVWSSDKETVATVKDGVVTAKGVGEATITAAVGTLKATCKVTVKLSATGISLDKTTLTLEKGKYETLTATVEPKGSTDEVVWSSDKPEIATVDQTGKVTAVGGGTAKITATAGTKSVTCDVTVTVPVEKVTLDQTSLFLKVGDPAATLKATVTPDEATDKTVIWESDDKAVATVDQTGKVTAVGKGKAIITAKAGGKTATCTVTVIDPAKSISLPKDGISILVGEEKVVVITVDPTDATISNITYTTSDEKIFTVSEDGNIKGISKGTAKLTVTAANEGNTKLEAECTVTVTDVAIPATGIILNETDIKLEVEDSRPLTATLTPANTTDKITWTSSDATIVSVDETGKITALKVGAATITAKANDTVSAQCKVTVTAKTIPVTSITLDTISAELIKGASLKLTATVAPVEATDKTVTWESGDEKVATVDANGKVTAVGGGKTTITATAGTKSASCEITVKVPVTGVTLNRTELSLEKGGSAELTATVAPEDADDKTVTWTSSDEKVATVDENGKVTAVGGGKATITAKAGDKTATCEVIVTVPVTGVTLNKTELSLEKGESAELTATVAPEDATDNTVTWTSSDEKVATVDANGKVTAVAAGTATITVTSNADSTKKASCTVTVTETVVTTPEETEPEETEPEETKPEETEPEETKPEETEPEETKPEETEPEETKPEETKPEETKPEEPTINEGSATGETEVKKDTEIKIEIPELNVTLEAKAGTFEEAVSKIIAEVEVKLATASDEEKAAVIAAAIKSLANAADAVSVNEVISVSLKDQNGKAVEPVDGASVKVTLPYDGKSNYVAYIGENVVEFIKLTIADGIASFEAKHFSSYYLVSLSDDAVKAVEGEGDTSTTEPDSENDGKGDEGNKPTGIVIALVPAVTAAVATVIFKKRK